MKFFVVTALLLASLAPFVSAQPTPTSPKGAHKAESKQANKDQKATTKAQKKTSKTANPDAGNKTANPDAGKKTSSAEDAAYAGAYKAVSPSS